MYDMAKSIKASGLASHVAILRIVFGLMWAVDAAFKWNTAFADGFLDQIKSAADGQPAWLHGWFDFWISLTSSSPHFYATLTAAIETLIALALIFGFLRQITYIAAAVYSLMVWAIPEGFGGPYSAASTDIGTGIIYAVVFFSLYGLERMAQPSKWALDTLIARRLAWWAVLANPHPGK